MYKLPIKKICEFCGTIYFTRSSKSRACSKKCAKQLWNIKVREKGGLVYNSGCGRKKGITPWNKNKECPQLKGENNGFYGHSHSKETIDVIREKVNITKAKNSQIFLHNTNLNLIPLIVTFIFLQKIFTLNIMDTGLTEFICMTYMHLMIQKIQIINGY